MDEFWNRTYQDAAVAEVCVYVCACVYMYDHTCRRTCMCLCLFLNMPLSVYTFFSLSPSSSLRAPLPPSHPLYLWLCLITARLRVGNRQGRFRSRFNCHNLQMCTSRM